MRSFTAMRTATAKNPMIAIQNAHAFGPSCSNRLIVANQNAHAFGPSSTVARMKMKTKFRLFGCFHDQDDGCQSAKFHSSSLLLIFCFLSSSILSSLAFHFSDVLERVLKGSSRMVMRMGRCQLVVIRGPCFEAPGLSQIGGCQNLEVPPWDLPRPLGNPAGPPPLAVFRLLAHAN